MVAATALTGRLDGIWSSSAGVGEVGPITQIDTEAWCRTVDCNLTGTMLTIKHGARNDCRQARLHRRYLVDRGRRHRPLVRRPTGRPRRAWRCCGWWPPTSSVPAASGEHRAPGADRTELVEAITAPGPCAMTTSMHAAGPVGEPEEVAGLVRFLIGTESGWITVRNRRRRRHVLRRGPTVRPVEGRRRRRPERRGPRGVSRGPARQGSWIGRYLKTKKMQKKKYLRRKTLVEGLGSPSRSQIRRATARTGQRAEQFLDATGSPASRRTRQCRLRRRATLSVSRPRGRGRPRPGSVGHGGDAPGEVCAAAQLRGHGGASRPRRPATRHRPPACLSVTCSSVAGKPPASAGRLTMPPAPCTDQEVQRGRRDRGPARRGQAASTSRTLRGQAGRTAVHEVKPAPGSGLVVDDDASAPPLGGHLDVAHEYGPQPVELVALRGLGRRAELARQRPKPCSMAAYQSRSFEP